MTDDISDPLTDLAIGAIATHELYEAYHKAGFTEDQALRLTIALIIDRQRREEI